MADNYAFLTLSTPEVDEAKAMAKMYREFVAAVTQASPLGSDALPPLSKVISSQTLDASDFHPGHEGPFDAHLHFNRHQIDETTRTGHSIDILIDCSHCTFDPVTAYSLFIAHWSGSSSKLVMQERLHGPEQSVSDVPAELPSKNGVRLWLAIHQPAHMFAGHDPRPYVEVGEDGEEV
jgi:hypothetical protein